MCVCGKRGRVYRKGGMRLRQITVFFSPEGGGTQGGRKRERDDTAVTRGAEFLQAKL